MAILNTWTKSIVLVTLVLTMFEPTVAEIRTFMKLFGAEHSGACKWTSCKKNPKCHIGYDTLSKSKDDCSFQRERKYCCKSGQGPQCFFTDCGKTICPSKYHKIDRTHNGCSTTHRTYCCKSRDIPKCFDLGCPASNEPPKRCPPDFNEMARVRGRFGGCDSDITDRVTCCFPGFEITNNGSQIVYRSTNYNVNHGVNRTASYNVNHGANANAGYTGSQGAKLNNSAQIDKRTYKMEDGRIVVVEHHASLWDALFGNSPSSFGAYSHTLLLLPILIVLLSFKSASLF